VSDTSDPGLEPDELAADPMVQFRRWYGEAEAADIRLANAIALGTADASGAPAVRHVLLRGYDDRGFVFHTNRESRKARHLAVNARAAFAVFWRELDRQVSVTGAAAPVSEAESDAYFASRPREARLGAWASPQSSVIGTREELMARFIDIDRRYPGEDVPRPPFWGGFRITPDTVEFWQGRRFRLHDRFRYSRDAAGEAGWRIERLAP
jgi:pyridoxamine 5'-phosphate oxidase